MFGARNAFMTKGGAAKGNLYAWGAGTLGALGLGNTTNYSSPVNVGALRTWAIPAAGLGTICTKTDGTLWTWGNGAQGANGLGNTTDYSSPKQVGSLTTWSKPTRGGTSGADAVFCIKTDGTLWAWGFNLYFGQLGFGDLTSRSSPAQVGALTNWAQISAGHYASTSVKTDGTLWGWGYGRAKGSPSDLSSPQQVGALTNWKQTQSFNNHSIMLKTDGTMWAMGQPYDGQLGDSNTAYRPLLYSPVQVTGAQGWASPLVGSNVYNFSAGVKTNGTLWTWGNNASGQLGLGDVTSRSEPVQVGVLTNWASVAGAYKSMIATKTNGTIWGWGLNSTGVLGLGNTTNYSSPKQIGSLTIWVTPAAGRTSAFGTTT